MARVVCGDDTAMVRVVRVARMRVGCKEAVVGTMWLGGDGVWVVPGRVGESRQQRKGKKAGPTLGGVSVRFYPTAKCHPHWQGQFGAHV